MAGQTSEPPPVHLHTLGEFELLEPIGQGGMAKVWRARHHSRSHEVAIKVMAGATAHKPLFREAFRNEARAVAGLDHPHIIQLFDASEVPPGDDTCARGILTPGTPYLVMELARGGTLSEWPGILPWPQLLEVLNQLLSALAHAHARQIIHLDLKPANILLSHPLDDRPDLRLSDFGISYIYAETLRGEMVNPREGAPWYGVGTPAYMAPEQFTGVWRDFGPWTDLYALGCIAWRLATGSPPFQGNSHTDLMWAHCTLEPSSQQFSPSLPAGFEGWARRLLAKRIEHRFSCAADAALALSTLGGTSFPGIYIPSSDPSDPSASTVVFVSPESSPQPTPWPAVSSPSPASTPLSDAFSSEFTSTPNSECPLPSLRPAPPDTWRGGPSVQEGTNMLGAGPGLFGLRSSTLVGRESERDVLWGLLQQVYTHHTPRAVVLQGPAGIGKSRLARWLVETASEIGVAEVLRVQFSRTLHASVALGQMVSRRLRLAGLDRSALQQRLQLGLARLGVQDEHHRLTLEGLVTSREPDEPSHPTQAPPSPRLDPDTTHQALIRGWLSPLSQHRPVILWLDDIQWGDEAIDLVIQLLDVSIPCLVILTAQEEVLNAQPATQRRLQSLLHRGHTTHLQLHQLSPGEQKELIQGAIAVEDELALQLMQRSGGNPLFVMQLMGDIVERRILIPGNRGYGIPSSYQAVLPVDIHHVWLGRMQRALHPFPPSCWQVMEAAAALGVEVDRTDWERVCEVLHLEIPPQLVDQLLSHQLVEIARPAPGGLLGVSAWSFVHGLLRESLEKSARQGGRWESHNAACASVFNEPVRRHLRGGMERVALHLLAAGRHQDALEPLALAARARSVDNYCYEALQLLDLRDTALDHMGVPSGDMLRLEADVLRVESGFRVLPAGVVGGLILPAAQKLAHMPESTITLKAYLYQTHHLQRTGHFQEAIPRYQHLIERYQARGELKDKAVTAWCMAQCLHFSHRYSESAELLESLIHEFNLLNEPRWVGTTYIVLGGVYCSHGRFDRAEASYLEGLPWIEKFGHLGDQVNALSGLGYLHMDKLEIDQAAPYFRRALTLAERVGHPRTLGFQHRCLADVLRAAGDFTAAELHYQRALAMYELGGAGAERKVTLIGLGLLHLLRGEYTRAEGILDTADARTATWGDEYLSQLYHMACLVVAAARRDWSAWDQYWEHARKPDNVEYLFPAFNLRIGWTAAKLAARAGQVHRGQDIFRVVLEAWRPDVGCEELRQMKEEWEGLKHTTPE